MLFLHYGVPVSAKKPAMNFIEALGVSVTDPAADPHTIEWLYFEPNSPMHKSIQTKNHVAYQVDDLDAALKGYNVVCQPFSPAPGTRLAFIEDNGAVIELMESK
jgi:hypothetical protein